MSTIATTDIARTNTPAIWSQYLHRRVMRLLLQQDQHLFQGHFRRFYTQSSMPKLPLFQLYDSYLKLLLLKDELLGDILPRIRRQLSSQNNQLSTQEETPTRGEIDWSRTITRSLNETPDLPLHWNERDFIFTYHRQSLRESAMLANWNNVPATNARYTIEREHPSEVRFKDSIVWRESPITLDTSYKNTNNSYTITLQKLLGEMRLQGTRHAVLFAPMLPEPALGESYTRAHRDTSMYTEGMSYNLKDLSIRLCKLVPRMDIKLLQDRLKALLDDITSNETFPERPEPACHGIILDEDTINDGRSRPVSYNVLCPKPHIGEGVFDLVNDKVHCLKDPHICHIYGQAKIPPFVIRATTHDAMNQQSSDIRNRADETLKQAEENGEEEKAEQLRNHIFLGVGRAVEQYVKLRGNTDTIDASFEEWIFGDYWKKHPRCLTKETRDILLSGAYVWDEYKQTTLNDWAAPAVQFCRAKVIERKGYVM